MELYAQVPLQQASADSPQLPLKELGELSGVHTGSNRMQMEALMGELEKRLYAGGQVDFTDWKRRFRAQLRNLISVFQKTAE